MSGRSGAVLSQRSASRGLARPLTESESDLSSFVGRTMRAHTGGTSGSRPFVGRSRELARLYVGLQAASNGRGSVWMIEGPAGIGKSRLLDQLGRIASRAGFEVRWGLSTWEGQTPLFPFVQLMSDGQRSTRGRVRPPDRTGSTRPPGQDRGSAPAGVPRPTPDQLSLELVDRFAEASGQTPQLFLLEDFHRSDPDSVRFLRLLDRFVASRRVLVVLSYRAELPIASRGSISELAEVLSELRTSGKGQRIELGGLGFSEMEQLADQLLAASLSRVRSDPRVRGALVRIAGGNPFFLTESVSLLLEAGPTRRDSVEYAPGSRNVSESFPGPELPRSLSDLLDRRLGRLTAHARELLATAAIIGEEFSEHDVALAVRGDGSRARRELELLAEHGWPIQRSGRSSTGYRFQHTLLRQAAFQLLDPAERGRRAGRLARMWRIHHPGDIESAARLLVESDRPRRGLGLVDQLVARALRARSYGPLARYLEWKDRMIGSDRRERPRYLREFFEILRQLRAAEAPSLKQLCLQFLDLDPSEPERSMAEAWYILWLAQVSRSEGEARFEALRDRLRGEPPSVLSRIRPHLEVARVTFALARGEAHRATALARRLVQSVEREAPSLERLLAAQSLAAALYFAGRLDEANRWTRRGLATARAAGLENAAVSLSLKQLQSYVFERTGEHRRLARAQNALAARYLEQRSFRRAAHCWVNASIAYTNLGDAARARAAASRARELSRQWELRSMEGASLAALGRALLLEGRLREAEAMFLRSLVVFRTTSTPLAGEYVSRGGLARLYLACHELEKAEEQLRSLTPLTRGSFLADSGEVYLIRAGLAIARGEYASARRALRGLASRARRDGVVPAFLEALAMSVRLEQTAGRFAAASRADRTLERELARTRYPTPKKRLLELVPGPWSPGGRSSLLPPIAPRTSPGSAGPPRLGAMREQLLAALLVRTPRASAGPADEAVPGPSQSELASQLGVSRDTLIRTLLRLVTSGAVQEVRGRAPGTVRARKRYLLTPQGVALARAASR